MLYNQNGNLYFYLHSYLNPCLCLCQFLHLGQIESQTMKARVKCMFYLNLLFIAFRPLTLKNKKIPRSSSCDQLQSDLAMILTHTSEKAHLHAHFLVLPRPTFPTVLALKILCFSQLLSMRASDDLFCKTYIRKAICMQTYSLQLFHDSLT